MRTLVLSAVALASLGVQSPAVHTFPLTFTISGTLTYTDYERLIEHPFDVPSGARRVEITLTATGAERRTVVDLGLRDPEGVRGWSGGRTTTVAVSRLSATPGYLPGSVQPGRWAVLVGVPNIRPDSRDTYTLTITLRDEELAPAPKPLAPGPRWFVGDLHAHSGHSDGRARNQSGESTGAAVHQVLDAAVAAGLDFVALTDHNTVSHWLDLDRLQPRYNRLLLLHGREVTTYRGHANTVGERRSDDFRLSTPNASTADVLEPIARNGAFTSINHPTAPDDERCMGCGWNDVDDHVRGAVHGVEVVNGESRAGPLFGWSFWSDLLNRGWRLTAVGGSDEHTPDEGADRRLGTPATVVWARELSEAAIVEGLKSGRVYIRTHGAAGPALDLEAKVGTQLFSIGAVIKAPTAVPVELRARVEGAAGHTLEWIRNGEVFARVLVTAGTPLTQTITASPGDWMSVIIRDGDDPTLLSNPIYVRAR